MNRPEQYEADILFFFESHPVERELYQALFSQLDRMFPEGSVRVQKTQISFYGRHLFAAASLPVRRKKGWPAQCLVVTIGLPCPLTSPRAVVSTEPYPGRWTNHVLLSRAEEIDGELLQWLQEAYAFAQSKR